MKVLITGVAGFIGFHVARRCLQEGYQVVGIDNMNDYYNPKLKRERLSQLTHEQFSFYQGDLTDVEFVNNTFEEGSPTHVLHFAAQAGVRYSLKAPATYIQSNIVGFFHVIEASKVQQVEHFVYASSSSVYGANRNAPFSEHTSTEHPVNLYAATKKSNEMIAHSYSHLFHLPTTGLRFFTVYGPWGRPDMAPHLFTDAIIDGKTFEVYGEGQVLRDFTYINDIVDGVMMVLNSKSKSNQSWNACDPDPASSHAPYNIYNIGNSTPVKVIDFIEMLERYIGKKANKDFKPLSKSEVQLTHADMTRFAKEFNFRPKTSLDEGVKEFVEWYRSYY
ncbi:SDR family NAD(P)-dependent oxidoreductase [Bacillus solimangrovi]|uniref:NAD(P)-binding domain-containing protein n=1 Tax=Bacillus solimangrovi TaxID=1305675 RepID=A0A1E5LB56_9BACI|nr:SDR family NAD(P)-dependent oxidoreductase [Bacillus solimangrovi]OEH91321.1 hypothetical protein BFG57_05495 [Bacillus solimangrovi]